MRSIIYLRFRYLYTKVQAYIDLGSVEELATLARASRAPAIGYGPFVTGFHELKRPDLAREFVVKVADADQQVRLYELLGMREEAREAAAKREQGGGVFGWLRGNR